MHRVLWLPTHPSTGAVSMDRYWQELDGQRRAAGRKAVEITCALDAPPEQSRIGPRLERIWQKYVAYPRRVRRLTRAPGINAIHLLDHAFAHLLGSVSSSVRKIATVHDLAPLRDSGDLSSTQLRRFRSGVEHLRLADLVLADSRYSAAEAVEYLGLAPERVRVLLLGVNVEAFSRLPTAVPAWVGLLASRPVVLSIGTTSVRKNLRALPAVFRALRELGGVEGVTLLRVGDRLAPELAAELRELLSPQGIVELGRIPNHEVVAAYHQADALLLPSRQEGFGFPVLEAMAAGCPVVCTNVTSLPEVGGKAALYFGPDDPTTAAEQLRTLLTDPAARAARIDAGRKQAATLTWTRHYERLLAIYREDAT